MNQKTKGIQIPFKEKLQSFRYSYLFAAFLIPAVIFWLIYICMKAYPFGNHSVLALDLNAQYVYFFEELRNKILNGGSLIYSWSRQLGGEFMGIYAYYLASPFAFLTLIFPKDHITEALLLMFILKTGCMGTTMAYYLSRLRPKASKAGVLIFSTCYALSSYAIVQAHNTMWIDNLIMLPLLCLGIESLIKEGKYKLFVVSLSLCLLTSFYIGYMACIFTALYFFFYYFSHNFDNENNLLKENNHFWKSIGRIGISSGVAIMISSIIILPAYTSLQFGKNNFSNPTFEFTEKFPWMDLFAKLFPGAYDTVRPEGLPFVYCGVLALILLPVFFCCSRIPARRRIMAGALIFTLVFSFNCSAIDIVWHGFQKPNWLNYRYSYMLIFLMLVFAFEAFEHLGKINYKYVIISVFGLGLLLMVVQKAQYSFIDSLKTVLFTILCLVAYIVLLYFVSKRKVLANASLVLLFAVCAELFAAGLLHTQSLNKDITISSRDSYVNYMNKMQPLVDFIQENDDSPFYRMEKENHRKTNDSMALGFYGLSNSSSTLNKETIQLLGQFGYASRSHKSTYRGGTPLADSLLGVKYIIAEGNHYDGLYDLINQDSRNGYYVYQNPYAMSLLYAVNDAIMDLNFAIYQTPVNDIEDESLKQQIVPEMYAPMERMNALITAMLGEEKPIQIFVPLTSTLTKNSISESGVQDNHRKYTAQSSSSSLVYTVQVPAGRDVYAYFPSLWPRECTVSINNTASKTHFTTDTHNILSLGSKDQDGNMTVKFTIPQDKYVYIRNNVNYFYYINYDELDYALKRLAKGNIEVTSFEDTHITANANIPAGLKTVFTSIPYDKAWKVKVDGEWVETEKTLDALVSFPITEGEHEIELFYRPACLTAGSFLSVTGLVLFGTAIGVEALWKRKKKKDALSPTVSI